MHTPATLPWPKTAADSDCRTLADEAERQRTATSSYYARNSKPLQIMVKEVAGMLAIAQRRHGRRSRVARMRAWTVAESMRPPNGAPNPLKPVHELYGEALLAADRPREAARDAFEASLLRTPNRAAVAAGPGARPRGASTNTRKPERDLRRASSRGGRTATFPDGWKRGGIWRA